MMSFGKSKVERFPTTPMPNIRGETPELAKRKKPFKPSSRPSSGIFSPLSAAARFQVTPSNKNKPRSSRKKISVKTDSPAAAGGGPEKNSVDQRSMLKSTRPRPKVILPKPGSSPTLRGVSSLRSARKSLTRIPNDTKITPINQSQFLESKKKICKKSGSVQQTRSINTAKRKFDGRLSSEKVSMPLAASQKVCTSCTTMEQTGAVEYDQIDQAGKPLLTPSPFEETQTVNTVALQASGIENAILAITDDADHQPENEEKALQLDADDYKYYNDENTTVTARRIPMRRSFFNRQSRINGPITSQDSLLSSTSVTPTLLSATNFYTDYDTSDPTISSLNFDALMLPRQEEVQNESFSSATEEIWNFDAETFSQSLQQLSSSNVFPMTSSPKEAADLPSGSPTRLGWIAFVTAIFPWKSRNPKTTSRPEYITSEVNNSAMEYGNDFHDSKKSERNNSFRKHGRRISIRSSGEMRRFLRMVRIETRRTMQKLKMSMVIPMKSHTDENQQFWMSIAGFIAGQAVEVIMSSVCARCDALPTLESITI